MSGSCAACGGFVGEPGKAYGCAGQWCRCPKPSEPSPLVPVAPRPSLSEIAGKIAPARSLTPAEFAMWLRGYLAGRGNTGDVAIYNELQKVKL